jgi:hypothetical protein
MHAMDTRRFLLVLLVCLLGTAAALVAARALDATGIGFVAVGFLVAMFVAREMWLWRRHARAWVLTTLALGSVVLLSFVVQRLLG